MVNKAFSQLSDRERMRKLSIVIRNLTNNQLSAEQIQELMRNISPDRQYTVTVHPLDKGNLEVVVERNMLHLYVPMSKSVAVPKS